MYKHRVLISPPGAAQPSKSDKSWEFFFREEILRVEEVSATVCCILMLAMSSDEIWL
jgi:hypothetical protein